MTAKLPQSCPTLDCSLPDSSVHGILQAILEWVAISFSRGSSNPGIKPASFMFPALAGMFFTTSTTLENNIMKSQTYHPASTIINTNFWSALFITTRSHPPHYYFEANSRYIISSISISLSSTKIYHFNFNIISVSLSQQYINNSLASISSLFKHPK